MTWATDEPVDRARADAVRPPRLRQLTSLVERQQPIITAPHNEDSARPRAADAHDRRVRTDAQLRELLLVQAKLAESSSLREGGLIGLTGPQRPAAGKMSIADRQDRMSRARRDAQPVTP